MRPKIHEAAILSSKVGKAGVQILNIINLYIAQCCSSASTVSLQLLTAVTYNQ